MTYKAPVALIYHDVGARHVIKRFRSTDEREIESRWYELLPDFCPELIAVDGPDMVTRHYPVAWDNPEWRDPAAIADLLRRLSKRGIHHRDVHLRNIVLKDGRPLLIDWYTAVCAPSCVSYDLYGEESGLSKPAGHIDFQCWTTANRWSIKEAWDVDIPAEVDSGADDRDAEEGRGDEVPGDC